MSLTDEELYEECSNKEDLTEVHSAQAVK